MTDGVGGRFFVSLCVWFGFLVVPLFLFFAALGHALLMAYTVMPSIQLGVSVAVDVIGLNARHLSDTRAALRRLRGLWERDASAQSR